MTEKTPQPVIIMDDTLVALWNIDTVPGYQSILVAINRTPNVHTWRLTYRFRYPTAKHWYEGDLTGDYDEVLAKMRAILMTMAQESEAKERGHFHELIRGPLTVEQFVERLMKMPFVRTYEVKPGN